MVTRIISLVFYFLFGNFSLFLDLNYEQKIKFS
jgi:hypothetical protein